MTAKRPTPIGWVLFDGRCGVCSRWVPFWAPTLERIGIGTRALQDPWVVERLAMDEETLLRDIRLLFADGRQLEGAEVYRHAMRRIWWATPFFLLSVIPGVRAIFDASYRAFAANRQHISAACGWKPGMTPAPAPASESERAPAAGDRGTLAG